jgi:predicted PhzF superfamily epimerase YddE/YHI9
MPAHSQIPFVQLDVFSSRPFEGNPLAVFPDARQLSDHQMQAIAREMNLSETTFILPRAPEVERERGIRVRIFTTQEELPFAGHPTLGTAFFIRGSSGASDVILDLDVGKIPVRFYGVPGEPSFGEMTQRDPEFGMQHDRAAVVKALRYRMRQIGDLVIPGLPQGKELRFSVQSWRIHPIYCEYVEVNMKIRCRAKPLNESNRAALRRIDSGVASQGTIKGK